jgi:hypothetical protein
MASSLSSDGQVQHGIHGSSMYCMLFYHLSQKVTEVWDFFSRHRIVRDAYPTASSLLVLSWAESLRDPRNHHPFQDDFRMKSKDHNDHVTGNTWSSTYVLMSCKMAPHWWLTSDKGVQYPLLTIKETWCTSILEWDSKRQSQDCFPPMQQELVGWRVWEGTFVEWQGRCPKVSSMTTKRAIVGICNVWTCYFQFLLVTPNTLPNCIKCTWKWAQARTPSIPIFRNPHDFEELQHSEMNNNYTMYLDPPW